MHKIRKKKKDKWNHSEHGQTREVGHKDCGISILGDAQIAAGDYPQTCDLTMKLVLPWAWGWTRDLQEVPSSLNYSTAGSGIHFFTKLSSWGCFWAPIPGYKPYTCPYYSSSVQDKHILSPFVSPRPEIKVCVQVGEHNCEDPSLHDVGSRTLWLHQHMSLSHHGNAQSDAKFSPLVSSI